MFQIRNTCSKAALVSASDERVCASLAAGRGVDLIVPSMRWGTARKRRLLATAPFGVSVQTYDQWLAGLWELYGDGSKIVDASRRRVLVRPLVERVGLLESRPSPVLVDELCAFVQEAVCLLGEYPGDLDASQEKMRELVSLYAEALAAHGMVECAQAERTLAGEPLSHDVVVENAVLQPGHRLSFLKDISSKVDVTVLGRSLPCKQDAPVAESAGAQAAGLQELRQVLYAGTAALEPDGSVFADEARALRADRAPAQLWAFRYDLHRLSECGGQLPHNTGGAGQCRYPVRGRILVAGFAYGAGRGVSLARALLRQLGFR